MLSIYVFNNYINMNNFVFTLVLESCENFFVPSPTGYYVGGLHYTETNTRHADAKAACIACNGKLAEPMNPREVSEIQAFAVMQGLSRPEQNFWIGLERLASEDKPAV